MKLAIAVPASLLFLAAPVLAGDGDVLTVQKIYPTGSVRGIAPIGDLNGDGFNDYAFGLPFDGENGPARGAVEIAFFDATGDIASTQRINDSNGGFTGTLENSSLFGWSLASAGDLDGDGVVDLAVGSPGNTVTPGAVYLLFLNTDGTVKSQVKIGDGIGGFHAPLPQTAPFGNSLAFIGDIDGTGTVDLAVGGSKDGGLFLIRLKPDGTVMNQWEIASNLGGIVGSVAPGFGVSLAPVPDIDGDGIGELLVGTQGGGSPFISADTGGGMWIVLPDLIGTVHGQIVSDPPGGAIDVALSPGDQFGHSVAAVGDLNGDGVMDFAVSALRDDDGTSSSPAGLADRGAVYIVLMNSDGTAASVRKIGALSGDPGIVLDDGDWFGDWVAAIGDINGDGVGDIAVAAPFDDDAGENAGAIYFITLEGFANPPSASILNGDQTNPIALDNVTLPRLGSSWETEIDSTVDPAALLTLLSLNTGFLSPGVQTPGGELLIAFGSGVTIKNFFRLAGGTVNYSIPVPNDPSLVGVEFFAQGFTLSAGESLALNALRLVVGN